MELKNPAYVISWTEYESGWGCRPDGYTIHISREESVDFVKKYNDRQPKDHVPYEYSSPDGPAQLCLVSDETLRHIQEKGGSIWARNGDEGKLFKM